MALGDAKLLGRGMRAIRPNSSPGVAGAELSGRHRDAYPTKD
jgi:hypothetical protein